MQTYRVSDGTITYMCHVDDDTTPREIAYDFVKGYDTNGEPITQVDVRIMDKSRNVLLFAGTLDIDPDSSASFDYMG